MLKLPFKMIYESHFLVTIAEWMVVLFLTLGTIYKIHIATHESLT